MKIIITGAKGQLGTELVHFFEAQGHKVNPWDREVVDLTDNRSVSEGIEALRPDVVINSGAYTAVDNAEVDPHTAWAVNAFAPGFIAKACSKVGAKMVQVSTDYVFNGMQGRPWTEYDNTDPQSIYGQSKLAGEKQVAQFLDEHYIVRTSWVHGEHGNNFAKTMIRLGNKLDSLTVVDDQYGAPSFTFDIASRISQILETDHYGVWHVSNRGACTWFELAKRIFESLNIEVDLAPTTTAEFGALAPRPANSLLDNLVARQLGLDDMPSWEESLDKFLATAQQEES